MLKYIMKSYVMSVASYMGAEMSSTPKKTSEVTDENKDWSTVDELLSKSLEDWSISADEYEKLISRYEKEINEVKSEKIAFAKDTSLTIIAKKLAEQFKDKKWEFELGWNWVQFNEENSLFSPSTLINDETFLSGYVKNAPAFYKKLWITPEDVVNKINELKPKEETKVAQKKSKQDSSEKKVPKSTEAKETSTEKIVIVKKWDTLWKLGEKYGVNYNKITNEDGSKIENKNVIKIGQKLKIPKS